jgi:hypothetical protein
MSISCRQQAGGPWRVRGLRLKEPPPPPKRRGWLYATPALLLAGYLLFAHGCHHDEDNELFAGLRAAFAAAAD